MDASVSDYTLILGDCLDKMGQIQDGSVDMILADLPYGTTACKWDVIIPFEPLWKHYKRVIKRNGAVVLFGSEPFSSFLRLSNLDWYKYDWVWEKSRPSGFLDANRKPLKAHENLSVFYDNAPSFNPQMTTGKFNHVNGKTPPKYRNNLYGNFKPHATPITEEKYPRSVIKVKSLDASRAFHPTQKPIVLLEYLIRTYTNEGETVLDNTMGSGSTGEACLRTGRRFIGIEKDEGYFTIASERLERVVAELRGELNHLPMFAEAI